MKFKKFEADFIYIDASHEYEDVKRDIKLYENLLSPGGYLFGHDFLPRWPGVVKAVLEFAVENHFTLLRNPVDPIIWVLKPRQKWFRIKKNWTTQALWFKKCLQKLKRRMAIKICNRSPTRVHTHFIHLFVIGKITPKVFKRFPFACWSSNEKRTQQFYSTVYVYAKNSENVFIQTLI